jgi:hypothetical protein
MRKKYTQQIDEEQVDMTCSRAHPAPMKRTVNNVETYWWWNIGLAAGMTVLLVASTGCYAGGQDVENWEFVDSSQAFGPPPAPGCHDTFAPEDDLLEITQWALSKWEAATGKTLCIDSTGIPIVRVPEVWVDEKSVCGNTHKTCYADGAFMHTNYIELSEADVGCISQARVLLHEIGHAIAHHACNGILHTEEYGVLHAKVNASTTIDEPAVTLVCATSDCPAPLEAL